MRTEKGPDLLVGAAFRSFPTVWVEAPSRRVEKPSPLRSFSDRGPLLPALHEDQVDVTTGGFLEQAEGHGCALPASTPGGDGLLFGSVKSTTMDARITYTGHLSAVT
jgi:hypothetical protein